MPASIETFVEVIGAPDARLGTVILHKNVTPYCRPQYRWWMSYVLQVVTFLEQVVDRNIGPASDPSVKQKYLDLLELTPGLECPP